MNAPATAATLLEPSLVATTESRRRLGELLGLGKSEHAPSHEFPLLRVVVRAEIVGDCAVTTLEEHYRNTHSKPLDVVHTIPLPPDGAVTSFEMAAGARIVRGVCKERAEARRDFESARSRGRTAALVESERDDVHTISLANVPKKTDIVVRMTIVERLRVDDGRFEYRFPTTISEKFVPGTPVGHDGSGVAADTDRAPDASRLSPPIRLEGGTQLDLTIRLPRATTDISGSIALARTDGADGSIELRPANGAECSADIVVRAWSRVDAPAVRAYTDGERTLVVVDPPAKRRPELENPREAVFVLDRSGSMEGTRIDAAKRALSTALDALSERDSFEILAFDTVVEVFRKQPVPATRTNIEAAHRWIDQITARGGTEALPALEAACVRRVEPGRVRTVLFLTDGDVANDQEILKLVRRLDPATRLYTVGIGASPSRALLERLARRGGGDSLLVEDSQDVEAELRRFESALAGPMACGLGEESARTSAGGDLFAGRSTSFFLDGARERVEIVSADGRFRGSCEVLRSPVALGALWARRRVSVLEDRIVTNPADKDLLEAEIRALGVTHQIQTRLTSFVAIDEESRVEGESIEIVQPVDRARDSRRNRMHLPSLNRMAFHDQALPSICLGAPPSASDSCGSYDRAPRNRMPFDPFVYASQLKTLLSEVDRGNLQTTSDEQAIRLAFAILLALCFESKPQGHSGWNFAFNLIDPMLPPSDRQELRDVVARTAVPKVGVTEVRLAKVLEFARRLAGTDDIDELLLAAPKPRQTP